jgi:hypothetical protein
MRPVFSPWPDAIQGLGPRIIIPLSLCANCRRRHVVPVRPVAALSRVCQPREAEMTPALPGPRLVSPALPPELEADVRRLLVGLLLEDLEANPGDAHPAPMPPSGTGGGRPSCR